MFQLSGQSGARPEELLNSKASASVTTPMPTAAVPKAAAKAPAPPRAEEGPGDNCTICLSPLDSDSGDVEMLACGHKVHSTCIDADLASCVYTSPRPRDAQCGYYFCRALFGVTVASKQEDLDFF